jgi:uridine phosphorylase
MKASMDPTFPKRAIIAPTDPVYTALRRAGQCTGRDGRIDLFRHCLFPVCKGKVALAGPGLGAPAAALLMERLVREGTEEIILLGVCGSLVPELRIGDLFLPTGGITEEGTSPLYSEGAVPSPSEGLTAMIRAVCRSQDHSLKEGLIWTTDAPYRETSDKIAHYRKQGVMAVDMEFTALATVAVYHKIAFAALMVISDERQRGEKKMGFQSHSFREGLKKAAGLAIEAFSRGE